MFLPYLVTLLLVKVSAEYFYEVSPVDLPSFDHVTCGDNIGRSLLYADIFFPIEERVSVLNWIELN